MIDEIDIATERMERDLAAELIDPKDAPEIEVADLLANDLGAWLLAHKTGNDTPTEVADHLLMTAADLARLVGN